MTTCNYTDTFMQMCLLLELGLSPIHSIPSVPSTIFFCILLKGTINLGIYRKYTGLLSANIFWIVRSSTQKIHLFLL